MALRVTQGIMYSSFTEGMNRNLSAYMESNIQSSSQKRVNRPSDDPVSAGRILSSRSTLNQLKNYEDNIKEAMGWLNLADNILGSADGSVLNVLQRIKVLAEEGATGSVTADNRLQISYELRQHFEQLINIANTEFAGRHIFGGHKTDQPAYVQGLAVTCVDTTDPAPANSINNASFHVIAGDTSKTLLLQPYDAAKTGTSAAAGDASYRYSDDGGKTWKTATVVEDNIVNPDDPSAPLQCRIQVGGVQVMVSDRNAAVTYVNPDNAHATNNGSWLYVRPTAVYQGDDKDTQVVTGYKPSGANAALTGTAEGNFSRDVAVRLDSIDAGPPQKMLYSFSTDDGSNWTQTSVPMPTTGPLRLPVPGGYLTVDDESSPGALPTAADLGSQFLVHPHRAEIAYQIGADDSIAVNLLGKDIFGGLYDYPGDGVSHPVAVTDQANLFEVIGNLIAAGETNSQQGFQEALEALDGVMAVVRLRVAEVGGRENRLISTHDALVARQFSEEDKLSDMEDVDITELMTRLAQQQTAYNSVLKSSSMIMQMSLVNFL